MLGALDASSEPVDIIIIDHSSELESPAFQTVKTEQAPGVIRYNLL
jgi:hypothetical protein